MVDDLWGLASRSARNMLDRGGEWIIGGRDINGDDVWFCAGNVLYTSAFLSIHPEFDWLEDYNKPIIGKSLKIFAWELLSRYEPFDLALVCWTAFRKNLWDLEDFTGLCSPEKKTN